jgi:hypothetical protein
VAENDRIGWATPAQARTQWPDAPKALTTLEHLLTVSYEMCSVYAPASLLPPEPLPVPYTPPARAVQAQILHARAVWTTARATADALGIDDPAAAIATTTPTLDGKVKQMLRPPAGVPMIG